MEKIEYDAKTYEENKPTKGWVIGDKCFLVGTGEYGVVKIVRYNDLVLDVDGKNVVINVKYVDKVDD